MTRLLLLLLACAALLAPGCNTLPDEDPGFEVRLAGRVNAP